MIEPRATLRLQFHAGFTLDDALPWLDYFADLGISHLYASPLFRARPGSSHGYDVVDPTRINPELGGEPALLRLIQGLRQRGMGLLMDIVPNHMGIGGGANPWWQDVLEWGRESPYASFFDIQWESHDAALRGQVLLPFLRSDYGEVLAAGEIGLSLDREAGRLLASHGEQRFPLWPGSYPELLEDSGEPRLSDLAGGFRECQQDREALREMQRRLAAALAESAPRAALERTLGKLQERHEEARQRLHRLLEAQRYRLASWRTAADDINWRRFFDISELVGLRVERGEVFEAVHGKVFQLLEDGLLDGLRIDHVDGLADPRGYCRRLRRRSERIRARRGGAPMLLYVEKILGGEERLPEDWLCDGTTGYDFMNQVSLLQHDPRGERPLRELWQRVSGRPEAFLDEVYQARQLVLAGSLAGDLENLAQGLLRVARADLASRDLTLGGIRRALFQLLARFPVYRTYAGACGRSVQDREVFRYAAEAAREDLDEADRAVLDHLERWLGGQPLRELPPGPLRRLRGELLARFQQLSSPTAAKAVEDTACYRSAALLSRNDVGFDPQRFAASAEEFHAACEARRLASPRALLATASHDHKRGEDARARLAALSELAPWFARNVEHWQSLATPLRRDLAEGPAPSPGDELILFQALLGSWPLDAPCDGAALDQAFLARMREWQCKALREAKLRTRWTAPDEDYERACADYLEQLLRAPLAQALRQSLGNAAARLMPAGALNGLAQCLLRLTCPGIPDLYQGREDWDFSLVDPDNRRPVDFARHAAALAAPTPFPELLEHWRDGRIKQTLIARVLGLRRMQPGLFRDGDYLPLEVSGEHAERVLAFARRSRHGCLLVVVPRLACALLGHATQPQVPAEAWGDTCLLLPPSLSECTYSGLFSTMPLPSDGHLSLSEVLADFPVNLLYRLAQEDTP
ncbi:malto-oligosyltrehalose synthase [Pseudomonas aeruginosa]|nr:malto-oligosyltrehalose synthase [Pseudomonas aeruginosa]